jgi:hypothetical protein
MVKSNQRSFWKTATALVALAALAALIWGAYRYRSVILTHITPKIIEEKVETAAPPEGEAADIFFADEEYTKLVAERRDVGRAETPEERARLVVAALISGPRSPSLSPTIPADAQLKSVFIKDDVALLNFDEHLRSKRFGSTGELFALNSLYRTVTTNVAEVDGVVVLVEGEAGPTLSGDGGHIASGFPIYGELGRYVYPPPKERSDK